MTFVLMTTIAALWILFYIAINAPLVFICIATLLTIVGIASHNLIIKLFQNHPVLEKHMLYLSQYMFVFNAISPLLINRTRWSFLSHI